MPTVLVVEDDPNQRLLYQEELTEQGYEVLEAASGQEALEILGSNDVDCVVLDIAMPGMDGVETLGKMLDIDNTLPVILNTAYSSYKDDFMTWAAEAYVVKSADLSELKKRVAEAVEKEAGESEQSGDAD
ncbi:MAG: response regulator [Armatimonadota bacterium]